MKYKVLNTVNFTGCEEGLVKLKSIAEVVNVEPTKEKVFEIIQEFDVYFSTLNFRFDRAFIDKAINLKIVVSPSTGTDHLDKAYLLEKGIKLFDLSKEFEVINSFSATSELAFTLLLSLNRRFIPAIRSVKTENNWGRETYTGFQLLNKTIGIIGMGRLGNISARIAKGFGMKVIYNDILKIDSKCGQQVKLDFLCQNADFITIHVHLTDLTKNLINKIHFNLMKQNSILINTSRGGLVNETDLLDALVNKKIASAGLDMIDGEWIDDKLSHPLIKYSLENENLLITPHIGGATFESIYGARIFMANKLYEYLTAI